MKKGEQEILEKPCDYCGKSCKSWCQVCGIYYCSRTCQKKHWPYHKKICAKTLPQRLRKLMQLDWRQDSRFRTEDFAIPIVGKVILNGIALREKDRHITWSWSSCKNPIRAMCLGCGPGYTDDLFCSQSFWMPGTVGTRKAYYCTDCHSENRFIHPKTLMTLREVWPAIVICWKRENMPKELLPMILEHFKTAWIEDIPIELITLPQRLHNYFTASRINKRYNFHKATVEIVQQFHQEPAAAVTVTAEEAAVVDMNWNDLYPSLYDDEQDFEEE